MIKEISIDNRILNIYCFQVLKKIHQEKLFDEVSFDFLYDSINRVCSSAVFYYFSNNVHNDFDLENPIQEYPMLYEDCQTSPFHQEIIVMKYFGISEIYNIDGNFLGIRGGDDIYTNDNFEGGCVFEFLNSTYLYQINVSTYDQISHQLYMLNEGKFHLQKIDNLEKVDLILSNNHDINIWELDPSIRHNLEIIQKILYHDGAHFFELELEERIKPEFYFPAIASSEWIFENLECWLKNDYDFALKCICINPYVYKYLDETLQRNIEIAEQALNRDPRIYNYLPETLKEVDTYKKLYNDFYKTMKENNLPLF